MANTAASLYLTPTSDYTEPKDLTQGLGQQFSSLLGSGKKDKSDAMSILGPIISRLSKLSSGNPADVDQSIQPQLRSVLENYDSARRGIAEFTPRGGGQTQALADSRFKEAADITTLRSAATKDATSQLQQLASMILGVGANEEVAGLEGLTNLLQASIHQDESSGVNWKQIGMIAGAAAATYFTGGAASPWLASAVAGGSGAAAAFAGSSGDYNPGGTNG